ncbi:hypothetical protein MMC22_003063 [Lobaria immixta]|nr:hypothetical protein [Lobaria immixta]
MTFSIYTVEGSTFLTLRLLILLFVVAFFAPVNSAQFDIAYLPDDIQYSPDDIQYSPDDIQYYPDQTQYYTKGTQDYPDETQYYADTTKYNPDEPIIVPPILSADDDATACDNGSGDHRDKRACCLGKPEEKLPDGGYLRVYKCRKCTFRSLSSNNLFISNWHC